MSSPPTDPSAERIPLLPRRDFLKRAATGVALLAVRPWPAMAGPFEAYDFSKLVPTDKKLQPAWVEALFARGTPGVLHGSDLRFVGMPVGGIGAGQLYLGGDGRLWHWDIFNRVENSGTSGPHYAQPLLPSSPLRQVFSLTIGPDTRTLDHTGFAAITFRGEYPIGRVEYADPGVPVTVQLEAFSPFIPLNTDDSSLPATILEYTLRNISAAPVQATIAGELENGVCLNNRWLDGILRNEVIREPGLTILCCSAEKAAAEPGRSYTPTWLRLSPAVTTPFRLARAAMGATFGVVVVSASTRSLARSSPMEARAE
ncbi:MAG: GH116 family glycosyl-hydrolase, partial [Opitutae bacterium]